MTANKHRLREWGEKRMAQGSRSLPVWLDPDVVHKMDALKKHFGRQRRGNNRNLIRRAIERLYDSVFSP